MNSEILPQAVAISGPLLGLGRFQPDIIKKIHKFVQNSDSNLKLAPNPELDEMTRRTKSIIRAFSSHFPERRKGQVYPYRFNSTGHLGYLQRVQRRGGFSPDQPETHRRQEKERNMLRYTLMVLVILAMGQPIAGQEPFSVGIMPRVGLFVPDTYFYEEFASFGGDQPNEWTNGALGRSAYVSLGIQAGWEESGLLLRGELGRTFEGWLYVTHALEQPRVLFDPPEIVYTNLDVPMAITFANFQVVLPARFNPWGIEPYFLLGGGGKWYHFDEPTEEYTVEPIFPSDGFTASLELGAGLTRTVRGIGFDLQVRDGLSKYWGKYQNDLVVSGGLIWRLR